MQVLWLTCNNNIWDSHWKHISLCHYNAFILVSSRKGHVKLAQLFFWLSLRFLYFIATLSRISGNCNVLGRKPRALVWPDGKDQPLWRHTAIPQNLHFPCCAMENCMCCKETSWSVSWSFLKDYLRIEDWTTALHQCVFLLFMCLCVLTSFVSNVMLHGFNAT